MASRSVRLSVVALSILVMPSGCGHLTGGSSPAESCSPPAHEDRLLAAYRADPVFAVHPPEALTVGTPAVEHGCRQVGSPDPAPGNNPAPLGDGTGRTATRVSLFFALNVGFSQKKLTAMYEPGIRARGWAPEPLDLAPSTTTGQRQAGLYYCKQIDGVPSFLSVYEQWAGTADGRVDVGVSPSPDSGYPEAGSLDVRITAVRGVRCTG